jgi:Flp pilus assembly pilin Flp
MERLGTLKRQAQYTPMKHLRRFLHDEQGQDLIEYTLLMAFIALASAAIFVQAGGSVNSIWQGASNQLSNAAASAS